jgi:hypothetical protein
MITEISFDMNTKRNYLAIKHMHYLQGLPCNIYYPLETSKPLYNDSSQQYEYNSIPDEDGRFLVTGVYGLQELTGLELEGYASFNDDEGLIYTIGEQLAIPRNSKVEIFFRDGMKVFRTQDTKVVNANNGDPLYGIHSIVPVI